MSLVQQFVAATAATLDIINDLTLSPNEANSAILKGELVNKEQSKNQLVTTHVGWGSSGKQFIEINRRSVVNTGVSNTTSTYLDEDGTILSAKPLGFAYGEVPHGGALSTSLYLASIPTVNSGSLLDANSGKRYNKISGYTKLSANGRCVYKTLKTATEQSFIIPASSSPIQFTHPPLSEGDSFSFFSITSSSSTGEVFLGATGYIENSFAANGVKILLQGAWRSGLGEMGTELSQKGLLPSQNPGSPVNTWPNINSLPNVVDYVVVTAETINGGKVFDAVVLKDGTVVQPDGTPLIIPVGFGVPPGLGYLTVRHKRHLSIKSPPNSVYIEEGVPIFYDFTIAQNQAYQNPAITSNAAMAELSSGKFALWGGNAGVGGAADNRVAATGFLTLNDYQTIITAVTNNGGNTITNTYHQCDVNMNGEVKATGPNNDPQFVLNTVLGGDSTKIITAHI